MDLKSEIISYAKSSGASVVGFADAARFANAPKGHHPNDFMPEAKSVISMGVSMPRRLVDWEGLMANSDNIPNDEVRWQVESEHWYGRVGYEAMNIRLDQLGLMLSIYLEERGHASLSFPATYAAHAGIMQKIPGFFAPFSHRHAAVLCGLGEFGFNNLVITPKFGPRIRFMSIITAAEIEQDELQETPVCLGEGCLACVKACGIPEQNLHAISPKASRKDGIFIDMPSEVDKSACFRKYDGKAHCWGKCIAVCPVGK
jgi:epoxyqueuosine reductase QueG